MVFIAYAVALSCIESRTRPVWQVAHASSILMLYYDRDYTEITASNFMHWCATNVTDDLFSSRSTHRKGYGPGYGIDCLINTTDQRSC